MNNIINNGIKSKDRVLKYGEVFTPQNIVKDMINLIPDEVRENLDSTWLEPTCGNGNFLVEILNIKMNIAQQLGLENYDLNVFKAVCSIYGIDIQYDNVIEAVYRMHELVQTRYKQFTGVDVNTKLDHIIKYILKQNIVWGNALTEQLMEDGSELLIPEWTLDGETVLRKDFSLASMTEGSLLYGMPTNIYKPVKYTMVNKAIAQEVNI